MSDVASAASGLYILVVDDHVAGAQTTGWIVEVFGHSYDLAHTPDEALDKARRRPPDVVVMDIGLPGTNGLDLCAHMRTLPGLERTVFIAHTGHIESAYRERAAEAGCAHFLLKPSAPEALEAILKDIARELRPE